MGPLRVLETDRLIIRPYDSDDFDAYYSLMTDKRATGYALIAPHDRTYAALRRHLENVIRSY